MSWKILQRLYQRANNLLVVAAARTEFDLNINGDFWGELNEDGIDTGRFQHLRIGPMPLDDVGELACKRLGKSFSELDDTISKTIQRQSGGNPLLACEILDVMYKDDSPDATADDGEDGAVSKVEELLLNRLDELSPVDRSHLNLGAILGFTFAEKDVVLVMERYNDVMGEDKARHAANVHASLEESVEYGILKRSDVGNTVKYTFSHALWMKTIAVHILDAWKDEMRVLIDVATTNGDISIKYDWDELAKIKEDLSSLRQKNHNILESINELRALIGRAM
jgi:predicted ATPase